MAARTTWTLAALAVVALAVNACAGSMQVDQKKLATLGLPTPMKAMDKVHDTIAARADGNLYAGAAMVDITTDLARKNLLYLGGFDMGRKNQGVRDPIYAHALYLDDGKTPFVLVTIDTIGYGNDDSKASRARITDRYADRVIISAIHDHVAPDTIGYWGPALGGFLPIASGRVPEYMAAVEILIANAVDQAALAAKPARLRVAQGNVDPSLSLNIHPQIRNQKDDVVRVLTVEGADGSAIATVANWGCHVEALWDDTKLSADWAGVFYNRIKADVGGVPLFIEGALGGLVDVNPGDAKMALEPEIMEVFLKHMSIDDRLALRDRIGNGLADAVLAAVKAGPAPVGPAGVTLLSANKEFQFPVKNWVFEYMGNRKLIERKLQTVKGTTMMSSEITVLQVLKGTEVLFDLASVPGEPAPTVVAELDKTSDAPVKFTMSLGNDEVGYMVREEDWNLPQYEYERTMSLGKSTATTVINVTRELRNAL